MPVMITRSAPVTRLASVVYVALASIASFSHVGARRSIARPKPSPIRTAANRYRRTSEPETGRSAPAQQV